MIRKANRLPPLKSQAEIDAETPPFSAAAYVLMFGTVGLMGLAAWAMGAA